MSRKRENNRVGSRERKKTGGGKKGKKKTPPAEVKKATKCPYCSGYNFVRAGFRAKKHEKIQLYFCKNCQKKFTVLINRGKTYPLAIILNSLILANRFYSPKMIAERFCRDYGFKISPETIANWLKEYQNYTPFKRMWSYLKAKVERGQIKSKEIVFEQKLLHRQIYDFKFHRGKTKLVLEEDFKNYKLAPVGDFLELTIAECPHQVFRESETRASEFKNIFNLDGVRITRKENRASQMAKFVMQAVSNNKERHRRLQEFMFFCDSSTLAVETPVLLDSEDISHYRNILNFNVPLNIESGKVVTGHIDLIQIRNGAVHIMDFKPSAKKYKPIEQLTIYALALARLTSLRLYNFKCAWFDEDDYFEFFPLHVVYKKQKGKRIKRQENNRTQIKNNKNKGNKKSPKK